MNSPFSIKRILVALDFEDLTDLLLQIAGDLAQRFETEVILLHAIEDNFCYSELPYETWKYSEDYKKTMLDRLAETEERLRNNGVNVLSSVVKAGIPEHVIQSNARKMDIDLVVLGAHRKGALARMIGTTVEHVIRKVSQPVWIVHPNDSVKQIKNVLCPIDCSPESHHTLSRAINFTRSFGAHLHVLHIITHPRYYPGLDTVESPIADWGVDPVPDGYLHAKITEDETKHAHQRLNEHLTKFDLTGVEFSQLIREGRIDSQIDRAVTETCCDLLILGACEKKGISHLFKGTAENMLRKLNCSVVTIKHCTKKEEEEKYLAKTK